MECVTYNSRNSLFIDLFKQTQHTYLCLVWGSAGQCLWKELHLYFVLSCVYVNMCMCLCVYVFVCLIWYLCTCLCAGMHACICVESRERNLSFCFDSRCLVLDSPSWNLQICQWPEDSCFQTSITQLRDTQVYLPSRILRGVADLNIGSVICITQKKFFLKSQSIFRCLPLHAAIKLICTYMILS